MRVRTQGYLVLMKLKGTRWLKGPERNQRDVAVMIDSSEWCIDEPFPFLAGRIEVPRA